MGTDVGAGDDAASGPPSRCLLYTSKWLGEPRVVNWSIVATSIWRYMGFMFVIFYGAIASIPSDIYEAAAIDGANAWQRFGFIIVPVSYTHLDVYKRQK